MAYYRIVSEKELNIIKDTEEISPSGIPWPPYPPNTIIAMLDSNDPGAILRKYAEAIADHRGLVQGELLYLIKIDDPPNEVVKDASATGWPESCVHYGPIPMACISIEGEVHFNIQGDMRKYTRFVSYHPHAP